MSRATELTEAVIAVPPHRVARGTVENLRERLAGGLAPVAAVVSRGGPLVVTLPLLCRPQTRSAAVGPDDAFVWRPFFVRRSLGAAIVDECLRGRYRSPAEVAPTVLDDAVANWRRTGARRFHWEPWVAGLPPGGRANVLADAVTWATALWSSFDWSAFPDRPVVGGPMEQWTSPEARGVRLTSRTDLRVRASRPSDGRDGSDSLALVSVLNGIPPPPGSAVLAYPALVAALRAPWRGPPSRSVGVWPDAGHVEWIDVDAAALDAAVDLVVETAVRWSQVAVPAPSGPEVVSADPSAKVAAAS